MKSEYTTRYVTCECGKRISKFAIKVHQRSACAARGTLKPPNPCKCGCGAMVTTTGSKPKHFVNGTHYDKWRNSNPEKRNLLSDAPTLVEERQAEEMKPIRMSEEQVRAEYERTGAVILSNRAASFALWLDVLGVTTREAA